MQSSLPFSWFTVQSLALSVVLGWILVSTTNASFVASVQWPAPGAARDVAPFAAALATLVAAP